MKFLALSLFIIAFSVSAYSQGYNVPSSMQQQAYNNQQISYNQRPQNFQVQQPQQQLNQNMFLQNNAEAVTPQRLTRSQELARRYAYNSHLVNAGNNYMQPMNNSYSTIDRLSVNQSRIMQASQYILANPVQTDFFLQSLLGINTQKISTENIKNIATRGDKFNLTRELIWLSQNRFIIESGQFNDARYSLKTIEKDKELADKQPGFFSTNTLLVGGGAILAGAGAALALGGGGGGSSASTDTGSPISLPEVNNSGPAYLACDYTSNYFNVDECAKCHDNSSTDPFACLNPSSTSSPSISSSSPFNMEIASALATPMNNGSCAPNMDPVQCLFCVNLSFLNFPRCTGQVVNYCTGNQYNSPWLCNHCSNPANTNTWICGGAGSVGGSSSSTSSTSSSSTSSSSGSTSSSSSSGSTSTSSSSSSSGSTSSSSSSGSTSTSSSSSSSGSTSSSSSSGLFGDIRFGRQEIPMVRTEAQVKNQAFMTANANYLNVSKFDAAHRRNLTGKNINFFVWDWFAG
ncbi:MAG: hypothetical protein SFT90_03560, partial [Rickettsiales bacterium]|nr:hypothetical protein [Rickettsiales bacterium]